MFMSAPFSLALNCRGALMSDALLLRRSFDGDLMSALFFQRSFDCAPFSIRLSLHVRSFLYSIDIQCTFAVPFDRPLLYHSVYLYSTTRYTSAVPRPPSRRTSRRPEKIVA